MSNKWVINQGQTGAVRRAQLKDASGAVDLSLFDSVSVTVSRSLSSTPVILDAPCTPDVNQTTEVFSNGKSVSGKGWLSYTFDSTTANIAINKTTGYIGSFKCMDGANPTYFPLQENEERDFFKLFVKDPLS
jgi:hypothetical protein